MEGRREGGVGRKERGRRWKERGGREEMEGKREGGDGRKEGEDGVRKRGREERRGRPKREAYKYEDDVWAYTCIHTTAHYTAMYVIKLIFIYTVNIKVFINTPLTQVCKLHITVSNDKKLCATFSLSLMTNHI